MESQMTPAGGSDEESPLDARASLEALDADRQALADRLRTPSWYYPILGVITGALVASPAIGASARSTLVAFSAVGIVFLMLAYKRVTGFTAKNDAGSRSLQRAILMGVVVGAMFVASMMLVATEHTPWVAATTAVVFVAVVVGGRFYDRAYDAELRRGR